MGGETITTMHTNQYADDTSLHVIEDITTMPTKHTTQARRAVISAIVESTQKETFDVNDILPLLGGHFNSKGWWSMISWNQCLKTFQPDRKKNTHKIKMKQDEKFISLPYKRPEEASQTICYRLALTGQLTVEVKHQRQEGHQTSLEALKGYLLRQDLLQMTFNVMTLGRQYTLISHILLSVQIDSIQAKSIKLFFRSLRICSTSKRIIILGPRQYGCATFKRWSTDVLAK